MVTRRAVLRGAAAASIGAIAAAHGAAPVEAATSGFGFGQLTGGAVGGFWKEDDAFQIAVKFDKFAAEISIKEQPNGGIALFWKLFDKSWTTLNSEAIEIKYADLKTSNLYFSKIDKSGAELYLKQDNELSYFFAKLGSSTDGVFLNRGVITPNPNPD